MVESGFGRETPFDGERGLSPKVLRPRLSAIISHNVVETARRDTAADDGAIELERWINAVAEDGFHAFLSGCNAHEKTRRFIVANGELVFEEHTAKRNGFFLQGELAVAAG